MSDPEQLSVAFHNQASAAYFTCLRDLESAVGTVNRQRDERIFRQLEDRYLYTFRKKLEEIAKELTQRFSGNPHYEGLNARLNGDINEYLHRMRQQLRNL